MCKRVSLNQKMIIGGLAAIVIPFVIAGTIIYVHLSGSLLEMAREKSLRIAEDASALIESTLMQEIKLASAIAADPDTLEYSMRGDSRILQTELETIYDRIGEDFFKIFFADKDGIIRADAVFKQQIGVDISDREYFSKAKRGQACVFGPTFPKGGALRREPIIVIAAPVQKENEFLGVIGIPFDMNFLLGLTSRQKRGETGFLFLVDSQGLVLMDPRKERILAVNLLELPGTEQLKQLIDTRKTGTATYFSDGSQRIAGMATIDLTGWRVVFSQQWDEVMAPLKRLLTAISVSGFIFLSIAVVLIVVLSGQISSPIRKVMLMMKQVTRHSGEVILQIGTDRKIVYANPAFEKISGLTCVDVAGTEPDLTNLRGIPDEEIWKLLEDGQTWSGRLLLEGRDDRPVILATMLLPFRNERGRIEGYLEIGRDITREHLLDQRMRQSQKLEALGRLAGGIAHDFNNILSGIFGYAELTLINEKSNPQVQKNMRKIIKASERASDLADQILTFSRRTEVEYKPLLPYVVVKEAVKLMRASIPSNVEIESKIDSRSAVMADPTQVHQIVMNLLTNAAQAIGDRSGAIGLELQDFLVDEDFTQLHPDVAAGMHVLLRVSDTGCGIDPECLDRIFEPFFTTKAPGQGTGLGLSVVHGIVKKMGGALTVESVVGQGSVFNVFIPVAETEGLVEHEGESILVGGKESVAVIDDEPAVASSITAILSSLGFKAVAFTSSVEALEAIRKAPLQFDVIVSDYYMPKITGVEIAKNLKKAGVDVPMILISGFFGKKMENVGKGPGICECIAKPVNAFDLTEAIRRVSKRN